MKTETIRRLAISVALIACLGAVWSQRAQINELVKKQDQLDREIARISVSQGIPAHTSSSKTTVRRPKWTAETRQQFIAEIKKQLAQNLDESTMVNLLPIVETAGSMSAADLKLIYEEIHASNANPWQDEESKNSLEFVIAALADRYPYDAAELLMKARHDFEDQETWSDKLEEALGVWARKQPEKALEWIRSTGEKQADFEEVTSLSKALLNDFAKADFSLAVSLMGQIKDSSVNDWEQLATGADTAQKQSAFLIAFREKAEAMERENPDESEDFKKDGISAFFTRALSGKNASELMDFMQSVPLSPQERDACFRDLSDHELNFHDQPMAWLDLMSQHIPDPDKAPGLTGKVVDAVTKQDPALLDAWIQKCPDGELRNEVIAACAMSRVSGDGQAAISMAEQLPEDRRKRVISDIARRILRRNPERAAELVSRYQLNLER